MFCSSTPGFGIIGKTYIVHGDLDGDDLASLVGSLGVVLLAESHDVHTLKEHNRGRQ